MVDTIPYSHTESMDGKLLKKILLGGVNRFVLCPFYFWSDRSLGLTASYCLDESIDGLEEELGDHCIISFSMLLPLFVQMKTT